ncbi:hypothetical protein NHH03_21245 [Stieleria sp. TO1_6]|uniref:hypothetical protein n=1 Tax=Stieleria tagensis TaxID=2956795 RepID=UPI00209B0566|nr:hypothetical protein [Stieleria tagensis]MCO8124282.1 hypothetical protein [Stieleria tagensis]
MPQSNASDPGSSAGLMYQWILAGLVSASARFIPIPFVDDLVRGRCRRFVISRTLAAHHASAQLDTLKPFYGDRGGCIGGCAGTIVRAPLKLLLFPIRKVVTIATSVRGVPLEVLQLVLLGRTLDRYLGDNRPESGSLPAAQMREAFDDAFARMDFRVVRAAIADALSSVSGWKSAATQTAEKVADPNESNENLRAPEEVQSGAAEIQRVLDGPETAKLFAEFDARFDTALRQLG